MSVKLDLLIENGLEKFYVLSGVFQGDLNHGECSLEHGPFNAVVLWLNFLSCIQSCCQQAVKRYTLKINHL